ncbi:MULTISPECIES: hypothetical protein [unclassified Microbacterium]|uniref:hypothetical protein n=1 Tax=unclassified Microbacterium TaxID=2609290 RepID=UPI003016648F
MTSAAPTLAYDLATGMTIYVNGSEAVTVAEVTRRDSRWVANGVVYFTATNGHRYGLGRLEALRFATATLEAARANMDRAYDAKGRAARDLKRARSASSPEALRQARADFNAASRALAHAEAAFRDWERRAAARRAAKEVGAHFQVIYGGGPSNLATSR